MEKEALKEAMASNLPFVIITASGERYDIKHQDYVSVAPGDGTAVIVYGKDGVGISLLDLKGITDIQLDLANT